MSAFICSDLHISVIASELAGYFELPVKKTANYLKKINIQSVNFRYSGKTRTTQCKLHTCNSDYSLNDKAQLMQCFLYQACENATVEFKALECLIQTWQAENAANPKLSNLWDI